MDDRACQCADAPVGEGGANGPRGGGAVRSRWHGRRLALGWVLLGAFGVVAAVEPRLSSGARVYQIAYVAAFGGYLLLIIPILRGRTRPGAWRWWLVGAAIVRVIPAPAPPTDDAWRYAWEGRVQLHGFNPFTRAPDDPALRDLRNENEAWARVNHPDYPAVYGPLAQLEFRWTARWSSSPYAFKALHAAWDLLTVVVIGSILRHQGAAPERAMVYALCPLVLSAFAVRGHVDSLMILLVMLACRCAVAERFRAAAVMIGLAASCKLVAIVLLPTLVVRRWRGAAAALVTIGVCYLPFRDAGAGILHGLVRFTGSTEFFSFLGTIGLTDFATPGTRVAAGATLIVFVGVLAWRRVQWPRAGRDTMSALLLLSPIVHYWYLSWVLAFVAARKRVGWSWIVTSLGMVVYFEAEGVRQRTGTWTMPVWTERWVWGTLMVAVAVEYVIRRVHGARPSRTFGTAG